jgi:TRAP-type C4-dicarboxylate transport system permease small subunit
LSPDALLTALLKGFLAFLLLAIVVMVFGNVVLRYGFNSGIDISEELSRWCLVWITFIGAALALREGRHLGVDALVVRLTRRGRSVCFFITRVLMLVVSVLFFLGSLRQTRIDWDVAAPVTGLSNGYFYGVAVLFGAAASLLTAWDLVRLLRGRLSDAQLVGVVEQEGAR